MKKSRFSESQIISILKPAQFRHPGAGTVPGAWDELSPVLPLAQQGRRFSCYAAVETGTIHNNQLSHCRRLPHYKFGRGYFQP
jgi:hypothetical protein